ncbi:hypothetical protein V2G26_004501 [Clonostachys chloroleuca]
MSDSQADEEDDDSEKNAGGEDMTDEDELQLPATEIGIEQFRQVISSSPVFEEFLDELYHLAYPSMQTRMERLQLRWKRQRRYPNAETRKIITELESSEHQSITMTTKQPGWSDRLQGVIEAYSGERWDWWPLAPRCQPLEPGQVGLTWKCTCGRLRSAVVHKRFGKGINKTIDQVLDSGTSQPTSPGTGDLRPPAIPLRTLSPGKIVRPWQPRT